MTTRHALVRGAALAYPILVTMLVLATVNHFWPDAVAALAGLGAAVTIPRFARRASRGLGPWACTESPDRRCRGRRRPPPGWRPDSGTRNHLRRALSPIDL